MVSTSPTRGFRPDPFTLGCSLSIVSYKDCCTNSQTTLPPLAIPMGGSTEEGFPGRVDQVDETVCEVPVFFSFGEWAADRRVDWARVPISPNVVHPGRRCVI